MRLAQITAVPNRMSEKIGHAYEAAIFYALTGLFGLMCIAWSLPAGVLYYLLPRRAGTVLGQFIIMRAFRIFLKGVNLTGRLRCDTSELDALKRDAGLVIVPNHPSLIDVLLITSRLPRITCIMKTELKDNIFLAGGARLARYIRNDSAKSLVRQSVEEIRRGSQLLVFPEGTRTVRQPVNAFRGGFALIAKHAGVPVQTVFIEDDSDFLHKGWPFFKRPPQPVRYRVCLGKRFRVGKDVKVFTSELENYFRTELGARARLVTPGDAP
jgi:1-acyl-sn-glycerol-3-phosphate acyltransferase